MSEYITVEIDELGKPTISVSGVKGSSCKDLTEQLEKALGSVDTSDNTREFAERTTGRATNTQR